MFISSNHFIICYCYVVINLHLWTLRSADDWCLNEVLKRLASGSVSQRRNAVDVVSKLIQTSSNLTEVTFSSSWYPCSFTDIAFLL